MEVREPRSFPAAGSGAADALVGASVEGLERRGKLLIIQLDNGFALLVHLRMTGQLIYRSAGGMRSADSEGSDFGGGHPNASLIGELPDRSTRVIITFTDDSRLFFNDQRKFGYMKLVEDAAVENDSFIASLGPEPLSEDFTLTSFKACLPMQSSRAVKAVLLDQSVIAGIGNIYADESLHRARIRPERAVSSLKPAEVARLYAAIRECLQQSITDGGSTARNYVDSEGLRGEFLELHAQVYGKAGEPCPYCGRPISKGRVVGRGTHYCAKCQR